MEGAARRRRRVAGPRRDRREDEGGRRRGKLVGLCGQLDEHGSAIEADLLRYYGVDLLDFDRGRLSPRRLSVLIEGLPADSATVRSMNDGLPGFSLTDHLLADLWVVTVQANSKKGALPKGFDHPVRAAMTTKFKDAAMAELRDRYQQRKRDRARRQEGG